MTSRVTINTETLGIAWVAGQQFRIALQEDFIREVGGTENPNPANANLITFTTNATGPTIATTTPADNTTAATGIVNARLTITFNRKIKLGSGNVQVYQSGSPDVLLLNVPTSDPLISLVDTELRITVTGLIRASTSYYVRVDNGAITDRDGFTFTGINNTTTFNFTTAASTNVLFRDLSANITGAFSPQMIVGVIKKFTASITTPSFTSAVTARGTFRPGVPLTVQATTATLPRANFKLKATTINCTTALTASFVRRRRVSPNISAVFTSQINVGKFQDTVPYRGLDIEQNALYFLTQGQVDSVPIGSFSFKNGHIDNNSNLIGTNQVIYFTSPTTKVLVLQNNGITSGSIPASYILQIVIGQYNELLKVRYNNGNAMTQLTDGSDNLLLSSQSRVDGTRRIYEQEIWASVLFGGSQPSGGFGQIFQFGVNMSVDFTNHKLVVSDSATSQKTVVLDLNDLSIFWQTYPPGSTQIYTRVAPPVYANIQNPGAGVALTTIKGNLVSVLTPNGLKIVNYVNNTSNTFALNGTDDGENIPPFIVTILNGATHYFVFSTYTTTIVGSTRNFVWTHRVYNTAGNVTQTINGPSFTVNGTSFTTAGSEVYGFPYKSALMEQTSASPDGDIFTVGSHTVARLGNSFQPGGWRNLVDAVSIAPEKYYLRVV